MKVGVSSYSFSRYMNEGKLNIYDVIDMASEIGFEGIEFSGFGNTNDSDDLKDIAKRIRDKVGESGMAMMSYTIGADFLKPRNGGDWNDEANRLKSELDVAAILGAPCMRHDITTGAPGNKITLGDFIDALPVLVKGCKAVTEYGADLGVKTMFENHGFFIQDSERCDLILSKVNDSNFGALVDIGNFLCADEDPLRAVTMMAPWAFHVHTKDFHIKPPMSDPGTGWFKSRGGTYLRGAITGQGNVDVPGCLKALKNAGYDGFLSIEFEGIEDNRLALESGLEYLRKSISLL